MPEIKHKVKTYEVNYRCDECGEGEMEPTGRQHLTSPPQYPHKCNYCGAKKTFGIVYPTIRQ